MVLASASTLPAQQQQRFVGGVVLDSVSGRPLSGADVYFTTLPGQGKTTFVPPIMQTVPGI